MRSRKNMELNIIEIQNFLVYNDFVEQPIINLRTKHTLCFKNKKCTVYLTEEKDGICMRIHSKTLRVLNRTADLYWIIGVLTYFKLIKREYTLPNECKKTKTKESIE